MALLQRGSGGNTVLVVQQRLGHLLLTNVVEDGLFGLQTQAAVKAFQQLSGLPVTGIVDDETWQALATANAESE